MKIYRICFEVAGEAKLGTVTALIAGEVTHLEIHELERAQRASPTPRTIPDSQRNTSRDAWLDKASVGVIRIIKELANVGDNLESGVWYRDIGDRAVASGVTKKSSSVTSILSYLARKQKVLRVSRGHYLLTDARKP